MSLLPTLRETKILLISSRRLGANWSPFADYNRSPPTLSLGYLHEDSGTRHADLIQLVPLSQRASVGVVEVGMTTAVKCSFEGFFVKREAHFDVPGSRSTMDKLTIAGPIRQIFLERARKVRALAPGCPR